MERNWEEFEQGPVVQDSERIHVTLKNVEASS